MANPRNNHCANRIGTLFRSLCTGRWRLFVHLLSLAFLAALTLLVDAHEVRDDDGLRQRYDEHASQRAADELAGDRRQHHVAVPAPAHTHCWLCVGWCRYGTMSPYLHQPTHSAGCVWAGAGTMTWCRVHFTFRHGVIFWHGYLLLATHCMSESTCI